MYKIDIFLYSPELTVPFLNFDKNVPGEIVHLLFRTFNSLSSLFYPAVVLLTRMHQALSTRLIKNFSLRTFQVERVQHASEQQEEILCLRARSSVRLHVPLIACL
jgi:hypothetical protein